MKSITSSNIAEVARLSGVSVATVSRVLNSNQHVSPETRKKVLESIDKLNYVPNQLAAKMRKQRSGFVVVVVPDIGNPFFSRIITAIEETAKDFDYTVFVSDTQNSVEKERMIMKYLRQREIDGAIFLTARTEASAFTEISHNMPLVLACETLPGLPLPQVAIDNFRAGYDATTYLLGLGHRKIVHIKGFEGMKLSHDRARGYEMAMESSGIQPHMVKGDFTGSSGRAAAREIIERFPDATAVFAASDEMAMGAISEFYRLGRRVPQDMSVLGFDDISLGELFIPSLSTVRQPQSDIGTMAATLLMQHFRGELPKPEITTLSHAVIHRESTGPV